MTHAQLMQHLADSRSTPGPKTFGVFPENERLLWTTDRNTMGPTEAPPPTRAVRTRDCAAPTPT